MINSKSQKVNAPSGFRKNGRSLFLPAGIYWKANNLWYFSPFKLGVYCQLFRGPFDMFISYNERVAGKLPCNKETLLMPQVKKVKSLKYIDF